MLMLKQYKELELYVSTSSELVSASDKKM